MKLRGRSLQAAAVCLAVVSAAGRPSAKCALAFPAVTTRLPVLAHDARASFSRVVEPEAYGFAAP